ncbi:leucine-rich repeat domain-containing protein, partial [Pseudomonas aeruginosa]|uniref:leucine-rich repeat domain-containing protein n=2 Tax=Pseudomonas aeruginosa TaxID=287 RepID=UPI00406D4CFB
MSGAGLVGTISPQLGNLTHLRVLDLSANSLDGDIPASLGGCRKLRTLNLSTNHLSGSHPASNSHFGLEVGSEPCRSCAKELIRSVVFPRPRGPP